MTRFIWRKKTSFLWKCNEFQVQYKEFKFEFLQIFLSNWRILKMQRCTFLCTRYPNWNSVSVFKTFKLEYSANLSIQELWKCNVSSFYVRDIQIGMFYKSFFSGIGKTQRCILLMCIKTAGLHLWHKIIYMILAGRCILMTRKSMSLNVQPIKSLQERFFQELGYLISQFIIT